MQDLMEEMKSMKDELHRSMKMLRQNGETLARKEHDYQVVKAQTWVVLKAEGWTATELNATIKGQPKVAEAMFERDTARAMYEANQEHINVVKLELRVLENQIAREWSNG
jgi:excinuclease UvrABC ATPase subunit